MNRHERRKKAAQARRARLIRKTMGPGYTEVPLPDFIRQSPAFKRGLEAAKTPEAYYKAIHDAARLAVQWVHAEPVPPQLRWLPQKDDGVFIAAALVDGAAYLADSPDAFRLLAWLDEQTGRKLTLYQITWALRLCRVLPMPDGSYHGVETVRQSEAHAALKGGVEKTARVDPHPCPHCGKEVDAVTSAKGGAPTPGCLTVCLGCCGISSFGEQLELLPMGPAELEALPPALRTQIEDMASMMRHYLVQRELTGKMGNDRKVDA